MCTFAAAKKRGVAQLVAFLVWDQAVAGSSPVTSTQGFSSMKRTLFCGFCWVIKTFSLSLYPIG